jgi:hypothetical protein
LRLPAPLDIARGKHGRQSKAFLCQGKAFLRQGKLDETERHTG